MHVPHVRTFSITACRPMLASWVVTKSSDASRVEFAALMVKQLPMYVDENR